MRSTQRAVTSGTILNNLITYQGGRDLFLLRALSVGAYGKSAGCTTATAEAGWAGGRVGRVGGGPAAAGRPALLSVLVNSVGASFNAGMVADLM